MWPEPTTLCAPRSSGTQVRLEPLSQAHAADLVQAAADTHHEQLWYTSVPAPSAVPREIDRRLALMATGSMLAFAVLNADSRAVGMTTYMNMVAAHRRLEIGSTWYRQSVQRTGLNTQCKLLLLGHAFEALDCIAVEFCTHSLNFQSRRAIERLGAKLDGIRRSHMIMPNGTLRDTAVYSIIASEWPTVKVHLTWLLERGGR